jgi:hypothetical protein
LSEPDAAAIKAAMLRSRRNSETDQQDDGHGEAFGLFVSVAQLEADFEF